MDCKKCGAPLEEDWAYCPVCGKARERKVTHKKRGNGQGSVYKRGNTYTAAKVYGYKDGRPVRETKAGFITKKDALDWLWSRKMPKDHSTLESIWAEVKKQKGWTEKNAGTMQNAFDQSSLLHKTPLHSITVDDLQGVFDEMDCSKSYQGKAKTALSMCYDWAVARGIVSANLAHYIKIAGTEGHRDAFTREELDKIRDAVGRVPGADLIYINCLTGYRPSEMFSRRIEDFVPEEMAILGGCKTEKGKRRAVTLSPKIQQLVLDRIGSRTEGLIFEDVGQITKHKWEGIFERAMKAIGIESTPEHRITPYSCRHTFASLMDRVGGGDKAKMDLMGHTTVGMTRHYQHTDYEDLRKVTDEI